MLDIRILAIIFIVALFIIIFFKVMSKLIKIILIAIAIFLIFYVAVRLVYDYATEFESEWDKGPNKILLEHENNIIAGFTQTKDQITLIPNNQLNALSTIYKTDPNNLTQDFHATLVLKSDIFQEEKEIQIDGLTYPVQILNQELTNPNFDETFITNHKEGITKLKTTQELPQVNTFKSHLFQNIYSTYTKENHKFYFFEINSKRVKYIPPKIYYRYLLYSYIGINKNEYI